MTNHEENNDNPIFGLTCPNLHITYFDKREVCPDLGSSCAASSKKMTRSLIASFSPAARATPKSSSRSTARATNERAGTTHPAGHAANGR